MSLLQLSVIQKIFKSNSKWIMDLALKILMLTLIKL